MSELIEHTPSSITVCIKNNIVDILTKIVTIRSHLDKYAGYIPAEDLDMVRNLEDDIVHMKKEIFNLDAKINEVKENS